jgi:hypothetical protein
MNIKQRTKSYEKLEKLDNLMKGLGKDTDRKCCQTK